MAAKSIRRLPPTVRGLLSFSIQSADKETVPLSGPLSAPMPIRSIAIKTAALLALAAMPLKAAATDLSSDGRSAVTAYSTVGQDAFTLSVAGIPTVNTGRAVNLLVTVAPQIGSIQPVQLSCAGLPLESTCTFGTATLPVNGGTTSLQITTMEPHSCESAKPSSEIAGAPFAGPLFAGLIFLAIPRRRCAWRNRLMMVVIACGLGTLTGCGNCTDLGTRPGNYTIKVIATSTASDSNAAIAKIVLHVTVPEA